VNLFLVTAKSPDKGDVWRRKRTRLHCNWILYVGDAENTRMPSAWMEISPGARRSAGNKESNARYYHS